MLGAALAETAGDLLVPAIATALLGLGIFFHWVAAKGQRPVPERERPERAEPCDLGAAWSEYCSRRDRVEDVSELERAA